MGDRGKLKLSKRNHTVHEFLIKRVKFQDKQNKGETVIFQHFGQSSLIILATVSDSYHHRP